VARCPVCPLWVYWVHEKDKVADSSDVVIQRRGFSIVDTHGPAIAIPLFLHVRCENQIFLVGRHQGVRRPGLGVHHIESVTVAVHVA